MTGSESRDSYLCRVSQVGSGEGQCDFADSMQTAYVSSLQNVCLLVGCHTLVLLAPSPPAPWGVLKCIPATCETLSLQIHGAHASVVTTHVSTCCEHNPEAADRMLQSVCQPGSAAAQSRRCSS